MYTKYNRRAKKKKNRRKLMYICPCPNNDIH